MRTLSEIIDAAKDGSETTHEECLYALLEEFQRFKLALSKDPKSYVGWNNDPKNPEHVKFVKMGRKLIDKLAQEK